MAADTGSPSTTAASPPDELLFAVIGYGEIARKQHIPVIQSRPDSSVIAIVDVNPYAETSLPCGAAFFASVKEAKAARPDLNAAVVATPPGVAQACIRDALEAGLSVLVEKPPGLDCTALADLEALADKRGGLTLFTAYHSTQSPALGSAKVWASVHPPSEATVEWRENGRKWHGGQAWVTKEDGLGVLDPLTNAVSILTELLGPNIGVEESTLRVPKNWGSPVAGWAILLCKGKVDCRVSMLFDWTAVSEEEIWTIKFRDKEGGTMELRDGGAQMYVNGRQVTEKTTEEDILRPEYEGLYDQFVDLLRRRESYVSMAPLQIINTIMENSKVQNTDDYPLFG